MSLPQNPTPDVVMSNEDTLDSKYSKLKTIFTKYLKEILDKVELPQKAELEKNDPIFVILNKQFLSKFIIGGTLAAIVLSWFN